MDDFLKQRAKDFWEEADILKKNRKYNLAAFHLEQACQLWLKYLIQKNTGEFPKTHSFERLINEFVRVYPESEPLSVFFHKSPLFFSTLEDAYITSRYLPKEYSEELIEEIQKYAIEFIRITEQITGEKFVG
ncbi:MAG TPA: HEPN domain-containing protein [Fimbriimonadales bacterium]|nr:HEPN domain-containing protein [Fimbriimonadales bacterium]